VIALSTRWESSLLPEALFTPQGRTRRCTSTVRRSEIAFGQLWPSPYHHLTITASSYNALLVRQWEVKRAFLALPVPGPSTDVLVSTRQRCQIHGPPTNDKFACHANQFPSMIATIAPDSAALGSMGLYRKVLVETD
jgi:hypothetical protein